MPWPVGQSVQGCIKTFRFLCHSPCCGHSIRCYCMSMSYAICLCSTNQATHRKQYDIHTTYNTILIICQGLLSNHGRVFPSQAEVLNLYIQKNFSFLYKLSSLCFIQGYITSLLLARMVHLIFNIHVIIVLPRLLSILRATILRSIKILSFKRGSAFRTNSIKKYSLQKQAQAKICEQASSVKEVLLLGGERKELDETVFVRVNLILRLRP